MASSRMIAAVVAAIALMAVSCDAARHLNSIGMQMASPAEMLLGMECAVTTYGLAGSNVFSGMPLTAEAGISYAAAPEYAPYNTGSQNPAMASFPAGVGLIGRAYSEGMDMSENVQMLPGDKFLRLELAKETGAMGTLGIWFPQYEAVIEFWAPEAKTAWNVGGIKACFPSVKAEMLAGMECAVNTYGLAGSNVFTGMPLTAEAGISYAAAPEYTPYNMGSQNPAMASFPSGVGLIGRAHSMGMDKSENVQMLPGDKFLRLELAKATGAMGTLGIWFPQYEAVIEFWAPEAKTEWDVEGIKACFA